MWDYIKPLIVIFFILGLALIITYGTVDSTGDSYRDSHYGSHYGGIIILPGGGYGYRGGGRIRGGK